MRHLRADEMFLRDVEVKKIEMKKKGGWREQGEKRGREDQRSSLEG